MSAVKYSALCEKKSLDIACFKVILTFVCRHHRGDRPSNVKVIISYRWQSLKVAEVSCYKAVTFSASWTRWCRTSTSFLSLGDSNRKSNTWSMTTSFSGGAGRGTSSISAVWLGVRRWRTSSWRGDKEKTSFTLTERLQLHVSLQATHLNRFAVFFLPQRSFGWACKSRRQRRTLRRNQSCLWAIVHCC